MSLDKKQTLHIAQLARIRLHEKEAEVLTVELNRFLAWIEKLQNIATDDIEPLASPATHPLPMRDDKVKDGNCAEKILQNAPQAKRTGQGGFFTVPKVVE